MHLKILGENANSHYLHNAGYSIVMCVASKSIKWKDYIA